MITNPNSIEVDVSSSCITDDTPWLLVVASEVIALVMTDLTLGQASGSARARRQVDAKKLAKRLRQIDIGKNTLAYTRYIRAVPKRQRQAGLSEHPVTPNPYRELSARQWRGLMSQWRRRLHQWDPPEVDDEVADDSLWEFDRVMESDEVHPVVQDAVQVAEAALSLYDGDEDLSKYGRAAKALEL